MRRFAHWCFHLSGNWRVVASITPAAAAATFIEAVFLRFWIEKPAEKPAFAAAAALPPALTVATTTTQCLCDVVERGPRPCVVEVHKKECTSWGGNTKRS